MTRRTARWIAVSVLAIVPLQAGARTFRALRAGRSHTLAVDGAGGVWGWGDNRSFQLGVDVERYDVLSPRPLGLSDMSTVVAGLDHSLAMAADGTVWRWGGA